MSQVLFGRLNVIGREKPLLLEESVKNLAAFADLQDTNFDDTYSGTNEGWDLSSGVSLTSTGVGSGVAIYDSSLYDGGDVYG